MERLTLAVDMDQVITDTLAKQLSVYNAFFGTSYGKKDMRGRRIQHLMPEGFSGSLYTLPQAKDFFRDLEFLSPEVPEVMEALYGRYELYICTAPMHTVPEALGDKFRWLRERLPFIDPKRFVFCGDKKILATDILLDDSPEQLKNFQGRRLLFDAPHNYFFLSPWERVKDWNHVRRILLEEERV